MSPVRFIADILLAPLSFRRRIAMVVLCQDTGAQLYCSYRVYLRWAAFVLTLIFITCTIGCRFKTTLKEPHVGHASYLLGQLSLDNTNSVVDAKFIMPAAYQSFVCLVLMGVDMNNSIETQRTLKALRALKIKMEIFSVGSETPIRSAVLGLQDLGQIANWYSPDLSFVVSPALISHGSGQVVQANTDKASDELGFQAGMKYRVVLRVQERVDFTNSVSVRTDFWGIRITGEPGHIGTNNICR